MIELSLKLIDRLIDLARTRADSRQKKFVIMDKLYKDLATVHADYLEVFQAAQAELRQGVPPSTVARHLDDQRRKLWPLRDALKAMAEVFEADDAFHSGRPFFSAINAYLPTSGTSLTVLVGAFDPPDRPALPERALRILNDTTSEISVRWKVVSTEYAKAWSDSAAR